jgi:hypothetical protein
MRPSIFFRIAAVLLLIFAALHTIGFRQVDPAWGVDAVVRSMQSTHFNIMGSSRSYWELFGGFGLIDSVFLVFTAVLAWQLASLPRQTWVFMRGTAWALVICFAVVTILCFRYAFIFPTVFSFLILACFTAAAVLAARQS